MPPPPTTEISIAFVSPALHSRAPHCSSHSHGGMRPEPQGLGTCGFWLPLTCHLPQSSGIGPSAGASCVPPPPDPPHSHPFSFHARWLRAPPSSAPSAANLSLPSVCSIPIASATCQVQKESQEPPPEGTPSQLGSLLASLAPLQSFRSLLRGQGIRWYARLHLTKHAGAAHFQKAL